VIDNIVEQELAKEALRRATKEWQTKHETMYPSGFQQRRQSEPDHTPANKGAWLRQRTAEILEELR